VLDFHLVTVKNFRCNLWRETLFLAFRGVCHHGLWC